MNKKSTSLILALLIAAVFAGGAFAGGGQESVTVEGTLSMKDDLPVIESGGKYWLLPPGHFYRLAWENGIKVGDRVKAEGFSHEAPLGDRMGDDDKETPSAAEGVLIPNRVWVNGKSLDISNLRRGRRGLSCDMGGRMGRGDGIGRGDGTGRGRGPGRKDGESRR